MDGFDSSKGVVILGATNRPEVLDKALLRPGRFDRRIEVEIPDVAGRQAILEVHAKKIRMSDKVDLAAIAKITPGASGADLANVINEGALLAVRKGRDRVEQSDLEEALEVVIAGKVKKDRVLSAAEKRAVAYHEVGHALVAAMLKNSAPVHKITIIPRTSGALGYTMQVDEEGNHYLLSKTEPVKQRGIFSVIDAVDFAGLHFEVLESKGGHLAGQLFFYEENEGLLFTSDCLINPATITKPRRIFGAIPNYLITSANINSKLAVEERKALVSAAKELDAELKQKGKRLRLCCGHGAVSVFDEAGTMAVEDPVMHYARRGAFSEMVHQKLMQLSWLVRKMTLSFV